MMVVRVKWVFEVVCYMVWVELVHVCLLARGIHAWDL